MSLFKKKTYLETKKDLPEHIDILSVGRPTFLEWMERHPNSNEKDWKNTIIPESLTEFLYVLYKKISKNKRLKEIRAIRAVPIGTEYKEWLNKTGTQSSPSAENTFALSLSNQQCYELIKKYGWDKEYHLLYLPVFVVHNEPSQNDTEYKLTEDVKKCFQSYLEKIYGAGNLWLPGYVMNATELEENSERFMEYAKEYFERGNNIRLGRWDTQHTEENTMFQLLVIPFVYRRVHTSAVFTIEALNYLMRDDLCPCLTREGLDESFRSHVEEFFDSDVRKALLTCFPDSAETELLIGNMSMLQKMIYVYSFGIQKAVLSVQKELIKQEKKQKKRGDKK